VTAPRAGTAQRAARGESTSSNSGTGSPTRSWRPLRGHFPPLARTSTPSTVSAATTALKSRPRRPVNAHHQTYAIASRNAPATAACATRKASAGRESLSRPSARSTGGRDSSGSIARARAGAGPTLAGLVGLRAASAPRATRRDRLAKCRVCINPVRRLPKQMVAGGGQGSRVRARLAADRETRAFSGQLLDSDGREELTKQTGPRAQASGGGRGRQVAQGVRATAQGQPRGPRTERCCVDSMRHADPPSPSRVLQVGLPRLEWRRGCRASRPQATTSSGQRGLSPSQAAPATSAIPPRGAGPPAMHPPRSCSPAGAAQARRRGRRCEP